MGRFLLAACLLGAALPAVLARNYYDILNVPRGASEQQIKRSYRKLALQYHPDKVSGTEEQKSDAAKRFADINHAYETLSGAWRPGGGRGGGGGPRGLAGAGNHGGRRPRHGAGGWRVPRAPRDAVPGT
jgi:DnaJ homolog subfamily B member 11